ncbi:MAG TPA: heme o synthase [Bacteroidota bacterium]|nr:heme o synthase [Bacteroidota bacterium]
MTTGVKTLDRPIGRIAVRAIDYLSLMKPELTGLSVFTALFGTYLAQTAGFELRPFLVVFAGTLLVGGGAGTLNQYIERREDSLMKRTERRPLPALRVMPAEALALGTLLSVVGVVLLFTAGNFLSGMTAFVTSASYLFLYTPLKRFTPAATFIGGIPGALPPVIGWTVVRNEIGVEAVLLFLILFAWQMPHFYSLAWLYRRDYARAGYAILTVRDTTGIRTARRMVLYSTVLVILAFATYLAGMTGVASSALAFVLGGGMLLLSWKFHRSIRSAPTEEQQRTMNNLARRLFFASLIYLPLLILGISADTL